MSADDADVEALVCPSCGCRNVQALLWVEVATNRVVEDGDDFDTDCFCPSCETDFRFSALRCV